MDASYICRCDKLCSSYDEYFRNHVESLTSWAEQMDRADAVNAIRSPIEKMLSDEVFARRRRAAKAGRVPVPPPPAQTTPKRFCKHCVVVDDKVVANRCCNKKCTFNHGKFDRRDHIRMMAQ